MSPLEQYLITLGIEIAGGVVSEQINKLLAKDVFTKDELVTTLAEMHIQNAHINADCIIQFLAHNGNIQISGTQIYSNGSVVLSSGPGTSLLFGDDSSSSTTGTQISTIGNAFIHLSGGGNIQQGDGSITISA